MCAFSSLSLHGLSQLLENLSMCICLVLILMHPFVLLLNKLPVQSTQEGRRWKHQNNISYTHKTTALSLQSNVLMVMTVYSEIGLFLFMGFMGLFKSKLVGLFPTSVFSLPF